MNSTYNPLYNLLQIAKYEAKLLARSWGFRVFALLGLLVVTVLTFGIATRIVNIPFYFYSLSGSLPLNSIKWFNLFQGLIASFLVAEYYKRDQRHDTNQVFQSRPFSNAEYIVGKALGLLAVFTVLNILVTVITMLIHLFFSNTPFAWQPYLLYPLLIGLPTVVFMMGLSMLLVNLVRSQAVVFVILLAYSFLSLVVLGAEGFYIWDAYGFYQPLIYSDFTGMAGMGAFLWVRCFYLCLGTGFVAWAVLLTRRLRQSAAPNIAAAVICGSAFIIAIVLGTAFVNQHSGHRDYRRQLIRAGKKITVEEIVSITSCHIDLDHKGTTLTARAELELVNRSAQSLESMAFSLNPGLKVTEVSSKSGKLAFKRDLHLLRITPASPLALNETLKLTIAYEGSIDERYCYLDIPPFQLESPYRLWIYNIPKQYAILSPEYVLLTPESGWYPISGLAPGAAFPSVFSRDFVKFSLNVTVTAGKEKKVISQGEARVEEKGDKKVHRFKPATPLPQISLTIGRYHRRQIKVDNVTYSLYTLPGHDGFVKDLDQVAESLPKLIKDTKAAIEVAGGVEYPYAYLSLVEAPIGFYAYPRAWTTARETVQPQLVFLPEMGTACSGADFGATMELMKTMVARRNIPRSPKELQEALVRRFIRNNLLSTQGGGGFRGFRTVNSILGRPLQENAGFSFEVYPNFNAYLFHVRSPRWPMLQYALEAYLNDQAPSPMGMFRRFMGGLSEEEETNLFLKGNSLTGMLADRSLDTGTMSAALRAKGRYLLAHLESRSKEENFKDKIKTFLMGNRFKTIDEGQWLNFMSGIGETGDVPGLMETWTNDRRLPGFLVEGVEAYQVLASDSPGAGGEGQVKTQVKFRLTNPTNLDGLVKISFRYRGRGFGRGFGDRGGGASNNEDFSQLLNVPANSVKEMAMVLDQKPAVMTIDTFISQNIPSLIMKPMFRLQMKEDVQPQEYDRTIAYDMPGRGLNGEFIVDNEDEGFEIIGKTKENWLRRMLKGLFGGAETQSAYTGLNVFDPPDNWSAAAFQNFYGALVHSGVFKSSGNGKSKVAWNVELEDAGDYDIFFYYEGRMRRRRPGGPGRGGQPGGQRGGNRQPQQTRTYGKRIYLVHHEDGIEEVKIDLKDAAQGWNFLGTFRLLAGKNRVELTDKSEDVYVTADAIKWTRKQ